MLLNTLCKFECFVCSATVFVYGQVRMPVARWRFLVWTPDLFSEPVHAVSQTGSGKTFTMEGLEYEHVASKSGRTVVRPVFGAETEQLGVRKMALCHLCELSSAVCS